ncbi:hypothetical protein EYZ11_004584 [Aspergillus tanneri]|nr:hypothetical protein EYZ11_004584 [Aspergillus tanneri]
MSISSLRFTNTIEMGNRGQEALCRQPCCGLSKLNMNCGCEKKDPTRIDASNQNTLNCSGVFDNAFPRATEIHRTYLSKGLGQAYYTNPDSECNSRAIKLWCSRPGVDDSAIQIKPAPEIVEGMTYEDIPNLNLEIPRGRPRSRSDEYQRHQLSKQQQRRSIYTAKSPLVVSR